jgi:hypothetical protein
LYHYFPAIARLVTGRETPVDQIERLLGLPVEAVPVPIPADCTDGFEAAYWQRPAAYLVPLIWQPMPALAMIPDARLRT